MAQTPGGARIDLEKAPLKYAGLAPWEIFLSEAQERMTLAVPHDRVEAFLDLAARREVEASVLGEFTDDGFLQVTFGDARRWRCSRWTSCTTGHPISISRLTGFRLSSKSPRPDRPI